MLYISSMKNEECNKAIKRIFPSIDLEEIKLFIENIDCILACRKEFYKELIELRYNIIKETYNKVK